ncbi:hypothetical protein A2U01_0087936, partial [Trifolium medium]|nr:hypothetical protein [Trifolium medium]
DDDYVEMFDLDKDLDTSVTIGQVLPLPPVNNEVLKQQVSAPDVDEWVNSLVAVDNEPFEQMHADYVEMLDLDQYLDTSVTVGST